jgi:(1->4)-alpha-D-glucan 1-alpha-D-glucosylmutase
MESSVKPDNARAPAAPRNGPPDSGAGIPRAIYRLQFNRHFTLAQAQELVPYLSKLGVSHLYASPILKACPGSMHGYDVCDFQELNPELGTEADLEALVNALRQHGMGLVLDLVPNHMGVATKDNRWWWHVLETGPASPFAAYFDIDWKSRDPRSRNKVLLPVLGDRYQRVLEKGELHLHVDHGTFRLRYFEHEFPLNLESVARLLNRAAVRGASEALLKIAEAPLAPAALRNQLERLWLENPEAGEAIAAEVRDVNAHPQALDGLLQEQFYRLTYWRLGDTELNYRRFFNIPTLAGLRMEDPRVFDDCHVLILEWLKQGFVDGLRIDHPDGLRDPEGYLCRLRSAAPRAWIVVEKILMPGESLPAAWPVAGTTGYDFLNRVGALFVDPEGEKPLTECYAEFTHELPQASDAAKREATVIKPAPSGSRQLTSSATNYSGLSCAKKRLVLSEMLMAEVDRLVTLLIRLCQRHWRYRDFPAHELRLALVEVAAAFPVYRTYARGANGRLSEQDVACVQSAVTAARRQPADLEPALFDYLLDLLLLQLRGDLETDFALSFQQLTGPAMAKGVEDTVFYCFNRLSALNEVGGDPDRFGLSVEAFHEECATAQLHRPNSLLTTSTHDTKRSEDVRARLYLLSEIPERWRQAVLRWSEINAQHRRHTWPDRDIEYLFYQTAVGAWPLEIERAITYLEKAACEAKVHTSWTHRNSGYEDALRGFVQSALRDPKFVQDLQQFAESLREAGWVNSLAQTLLRLTAPGVPDHYQGCELWDLSLVDPDNRRPVDFAARRSLLDEIQNLPLDEVWQRRSEGLPKLWVISKALNFRRRQPGLFAADGSYEPLAAHGAKAKHLVAFVRGQGAITVVPRLVLGLGADWADTVLELPPGPWQSELTGESVPGPHVPLADLLRQFPVALLSKRRVTDGTPPASQSNHSEA